MPRTQFGHQRTVCGCRSCVTNCMFLPGYLTPPDLESLIPPGSDPLEWARTHLRASPGALVFKGGRPFRIRTLVPASRPGGFACHWLGPDDKCQVHENAPYACAFFDCSDTDPNSPKSRDGLVSVAQAWGDPDSLYRRLWESLAREDLTSPPPDVKRDAMRSYLAEQGMV